MVAVVVRRNTRLFMMLLYACDHLKAMPELKEGATAPPIRLQTDAGEQFDLTSLRGTKVVLFFFPKANTSG
jgi:hypothetical protein